MNELIENSTATTAATAAIDENLSFTLEFLEKIKSALESGDKDELTRLTSELHEADLADLLELLQSDERKLFVGLLDTDFNLNALTELDQSLREEVMEQIPNQDIASGVVELESDDALDLLEDLDDEDRKEVLDNIPLLDRINLTRGLEYPEDSAGRMMQIDFVAVPPFWIVGQAIDYMREEVDLPEGDFYEIFVIDASFHLMGVIPLNVLLRTKRPLSVKEIMNKPQVTITCLDEQESVAYKFEHYNLVSCPVVDENDRIVGVITIDDVVDVIQEEADEDIKRLGGVSTQESITDSVISITKNRFNWLFINLLTALLASLVISLFDQAIEKMVALAILMPIVASMGGNAGTQTMTVTVRALATNDILSLNVVRIIFRETWVGFANGVLFALILSGVTYLWFSDIVLAGVIAFAMVINMISAGFFGILIPVVLDRYNIDPAVASAVFVTTVTDIVGFFAFLGLAAIWLL